MSKATGYLQTLLFRSPYFPELHEFWKQDGFEINMVCWSCKLNHIVGLGMCLEKKIEPFDLSMKMVV